MRGRRTTSRSRSAWTSSSRGCACSCGAPTRTRFGPRRGSSHEGISIDLDAHQVTRDDEGVRLTKTEWALLETLATHPGKLLTHAWLLERVWGPGYADDIDVLRVFVSQLRRKVERDPARPSVILTEPGVGYRWALRPLSAG